MKQSLDDKLKAGYEYRTTPDPNKKLEPGKKHISFSVGVDGIKTLIKILRDAKLPDDFIAMQIEMFVPSKGWVKLSNLTVIEK